MLESQPNKWSRVTRFLHWGLAATVTLQLFFSLIMEMPTSGELENGLGPMFFEAHEFVGLTALLFVVLHWLWLFRAPDISFAFLFPFSADGYKKLLEDIRMLLDRKLLKGGPKAGGLVGLVHGFGLLAATGMVITGGTIFALIETNKISSSFGHIVIEAHESIAGLIAIYWVAHTAMALFHHLAGEDTVRSMFSLKG